MLFPRFLNSQNISLNGIPQNYAPAIPADSVVQALTPFEVVKEAPLKVLYQPAFKGVVSVATTGQSVNVKVDGTNITVPLSLNNATLNNGTITANAAYGNVHFGKNDRSLIKGSLIEYSMFPANGVVGLYILEKQDVSFISQSFGIVITITNRTGFYLEKITGTGTNTMLSSQTITAIGDTDKLSVEITDAAIIIKRNTTVLYTHNLEYKVRLLNEAGTAVDSNAGALKLTDSTTYNNALVPANYELKYEVGTALGTYNVEIESELGRKILQKVIVVNNGNSTPIASITNPPVSFFNTNTNTESPVSWWNQYKTVFAIGGVILGIALIGAYLINKLSK